MYTRTHTQRVVSKRDVWPRKKYIFTLYSNIVKIYVALLCLKSIGLLVIKQWNMSNCADIIFGQAVIQQNMNTCKNKREWKSPNFWWFNLTWRVIKNKYPLQTSLGTIVYWCVCVYLHVFQKPNYECLLWELLSIPTRKLHTSPLKMNFSTVMLKSYALNFCFWKS